MMIFGPTHRQVGRILLDGVRQTAQQQAAVGGVHPSPRRPQPEGIARCFHGLVYVSLERQVTSSQQKADYRCGK